MAQIPGGKHREAQNSASEIDVVTDAVRGSPAGSLGRLPTRPRRAARKVLRIRPLMQVQTNITNNPDNAKLIATIVSAVAPLPEARIAVVPSAAPIGSDVSNLARQISHWRIPGKRLTRDPRRSDQRDARLFKVG
jgi:hypothetical protein